MATTGTLVKVDIDAFFDDSSDTLFSSTRKLAALNAAIHNSWPLVKRLRRDSSITLATTTFEYTPSATPELEEGFLLPVYVTPWSTTTEPKTALFRGVRQILNDTTWTIVVAPWVAQQWDGKTLHLDYHSRIAAISAIADSIELPFTYLANYAEYWLVRSAAMKEPTFDVDIFNKILPELRNAYQASLLSVPKTDSYNRMPIGYNFTGSQTGEEPLDQVNNVRL